MFEPAEWTFNGTSGTSYDFSVHRRRNGVFEGIAARPAVYVLGYMHPRGHMAGSIVEPVYIGHADDLAARLADHPDWECIAYEACNCVCVLEKSLPAKERAACVDDLRRENSTPCGQEE